LAFPKDSAGEVHYEGELVAVIGKRAKGLSKEQALSCVLGYTIGNDLSERAWQSADRTQWRAKNTDTFKPMGPWIVTDIDPSTSETTVRVNDRVVSKFPTGNMIYDVASYIAEMSKYLTLHPGDVIWMGTDGATIPALRAGDVVEVAISGIGTLRNPVSAET
jgi:2-keto-4-pentenoate hydratase/2-oxohepta-3-ene-1,7-dioic acid hydratase in catechol pathway